ncbi:hypothetical protein PoB_003196000 [Plakobranchus ocellatus]|uniref:Uncharacterized protein n=1 Tax=Plakobranchus ocellatus TaxID=259542 RepID=A0AAV4ABC0_9GAST|nr:hypothetical protein PoB_003196000 [Plakobranchus ocellatus]
MPLPSENTDAFISKVEMMFYRWTELAKVTKGQLGELRDVVIRDSCMDPLILRLSFFSKKDLKSIADVRVMAAKYRSAYPNISLGRKKVSVANVAAGPTGKDRDARPAMRDDWNAKDRGGPTYRRSQCSGPPRGWRNSSTRDPKDWQVPEQSRLEWRYSTDRQNENFCGREYCQTTRNVITSAQILYTRKQ